MTKEEKIAQFDPNGLGLSDSGIFGLPFNEEDAQLVILPVTWEVTVSYGGGTVDGPQAVFDASKQIDLYDPDVKDAWKAGIFMRHVNNDWRNLSEHLRKKAENYITFLENGGNPEEQKHVVANIDADCEALNKYVYDRTIELMKSGKIVGLLGGDHSTPLGYMQALADFHGEFGVLQIDAHADLRVAYEGFTYSHASIFYNALKINQLIKLVQVGIRDLCEAEAQIIKESKGRIVTFYDRDIKHNMMEGTSWKVICNEIVSALPDKIYISFDIDGLDPKLCPNTGTPVPGGFEFHEVVYLLKVLVKSGKTIIGFDLNEVSPGDDEWDANVGARILYKLSNFTLVSNKRLELA
ncbi:MAG: agmatinase family protein [Flavobacteriales bacterium]